MDTKSNCMNLVITGNPGVGKHTTTDLFVKQDSSYQIIDINKFAIEGGFGNKVEDGFEVNTIEMKDEIKKKVSDKSIIVGHLAPYVLDDSDIDLAIVLRKNPYDLIDIYKKRDYQESKIKQNAGSEVLGVIANDAIASFGKEKTFEIDTTTKTPERIVEEINGIIKNKEGGDIIDWLTIIEERNEFGRFFDY